MAKAWTYDPGGTLSTDLTAYYALSDESDSKGSNTLTNNGSSAFGAGKYLNAVDFGAVNVSEYLSTTTPNFTSVDYTMSCWANVTTVPPAYAQIIEHADDTQAIATGIEYINGTLRWRRDKPGVAGANYTSTQTLTAGTWYNLVIRFNGATLIGHVNGTASGTGLTTSGSGLAAAVNEGFAIGSDASIVDSGAANWTGLVDETAIWSRALTDAEIADLYNGGTGSFYIETAGGAARRDRLLMGVGQ